jgi:hypothetical protein
LRRSLHVASHPDIDLVSFDTRNLASSPKGANKIMKRFLASIALAFVLSASIFAGEVPTSGVTSPQLGEVPTSGVASPQSEDLLPDGLIVFTMLTAIGLLPG